VSPDGRIAQRDLGAKLVIVMVGLPARGKSYITKKMARYLNWLQHDTRIFNVGDRRRVVADGRTPRPSQAHSRGSSGGNAREIFKQQYLTHGNNTSSGTMDAPTFAAHILLNGGSAIANSPDVKAAHPSHVSIPELVLPDAGPNDSTDVNQEQAEALDQSAAFFDPENKKAASLRDQVALETLDELLDYIIDGNGAVCILDATNSTLDRRKTVMSKIRERAGPDLNVLFLESLCIDENLLERNIRLKLSGPDYKDKDPEASLADFRARIAVYEKAYVPLGEYEERNKLSYIQMIDVGRKVISHKIEGFLSAQCVYYLLNFNLAPRQIWITRHGESEDNVSGKLGGDSALTTEGHEYARALTTFCAKERKAWEIRELNRHRQSHLPPHAGDITPPNPHCDDEDDIRNKNFCVWTSMLQRSIQTAEYFDETDFDLKQMRMLNEIYAGKYEGYTYEQIKEMDRDTFDERRQDKMHYRYPGPGGEGYLDVINRLRPVIVELERMTDHCLLIGHRSVARILLAYFKGLGRDEVTDLDVPIGMLYCLEPVSRQYL
jgi:6-phosphofructo-2-kinase